MMNLTIREIAAACGKEAVLQGGVKADYDRNVSMVAIDSRQIESGGVFIATVGERADGHKFIPSVFAKGAVLAVVQKSPEQVEAEHGCSAAQWGSYLLVEDTLQALRDIAEAYRRKLSVRIVGITGSSGKTSTKEFIACVLSEKYHVLKTQGNLNNEIGVPLTLLGIRGEHEAAVVEMGISDFGEMHRLSKMVRPNVCVITNIGQSHLKDLKSRDGILKAKSEIFDYMAEDGEICLNGEDDKLRGLTEIRGHKPHFYGLGGSPAQEVWAGEIVGNLRGSDAVIRFRKIQSEAGPEEGTGALAQKPQGGAGPEEGAGALAHKPQGGAGPEGDAGTLAHKPQGGAGPEGDAGTLAQEAGEEAVTAQPVHVPLPGRHMVLNAAAAACVGRLFGLTAEEIAAGIAKTASVGGRANIIHLPRYTLIDDCYNANPESMRAAIDMLALADTKKAAILGDMFNLGEDTHSLHARAGIHAVEAGIEYLICVGEESRYLYQAAAQQAGKEGHVTYFPDREALMEALALDCAGLLPEGSTVLIKASHGMEFEKVLDFLREHCSLSCSDLPKCKGKS